MKRLTTSAKPFFLSLQIILWQTRACERKKKNECMGMCQASVSLLFHFWQFPSRKREKEIEKTQMSKEWPGVVVPYHAIVRSDN